MKVERILLDTNVLISAALIPKGTARAVVEGVFANRGLLLFSHETYDEIRSRLLRAKFDHYLSHYRREVFLVQLVAVAEWVSIIGAKMGCRDPDDDKLLETATMGEADCIVTGDQDLLVMSPFHQIPILKPRDFLEELSGSNTSPPPSNS